MNDRERRLRQRIDDLHERLTIVEEERDYYYALAEQLTGGRAPRVLTRNQHGVCPVYRSETQKREARRKSWRASARRKRERQLRAAA